MEIERLTVIITGAGRGLGAAMAQALARRSARLALVDLDVAGLDGTARECAALGAAEVRHYRANVADEAEVSGLLDRIVQEQGPIDALVNNAGILRDGLLIKVKDGKVSGKLSLADWQSVLDVNLTGVFLCAREAAARMIDAGRGGCIVNISSLSRAGNFGQSNYSAAKAGVASLTVVWAKELARYRIRVNGIAPGFIRTDMVASMRPEVLEKLAAGIPLGRLGTPEEIAHTLMYLLENDYVTGRLVEVDGGQRI
jgi:3-oxoacyl-[acyl-carrier protein] reductase